jgi:hypothetical protein
MYDTTPLLRAVRVGFVHVDFSKGLIYLFVFISNWKKYFLLSLIFNVYQNLYLFQIVGGYTKITTSRKKQTKV